MQLTPEFKMRVKHMHSPKTTECEICVVSLGHNATRVRDGEAAEFRMTGRDVASVMA
jgi:hypothetical protein